MKKRMFAIPLAAALVLAGCGQRYTRSFGDSEMYSVEEIAMAMDTVEDEFEQDDYYSRCDLHSLEFDGDAEMTDGELERAKLCCKNNGLPEPDEVIRLAGEFTSPIFDTGALDSCTNYQWNYSLGRRNGGKWFIYDRGVG
ncbi:hypothetical protein [Ruminococcus sp.]|uniref:hypothetical protein n=1 Tax=Ruminococcus sp. TaxID=41978 RepID=UPI0026009F19|nr:hypothetical protein [Ruminococcus sp.]MBQ8966633.1 hypothetical protein [Ruminococcus sp.]